VNPRSAAMLAVCATLLAAAVARADDDETVPDIETRWPLAYVARPLTLPRDMIQLGATLTGHVPNQVDNVDPVTLSAYQFHPALMLGVSLAGGLTDRLEIAVGHPRLACFGDQRASACNPTNRNAGLGGGLDFGVLRRARVQAQISAGLTVLRSSPSELAWSTGAAVKVRPAAVWALWASARFRRPIDPPPQDLDPGTSATLDAGVDLQVTERLLMYVHVEPWAPVARLSEGVALELRGGATYTFSHQAQLGLEAGSFNVLSNPSWNRSVPEWFTVLSLVSWTDLRAPEATASS